MAGKISVSIVGSCVTRDMFNSLFVKNWSDYFRLVTYIPRMSFPNIVTLPIEYDLQALENECRTNWDFEAFYKAFEKGALTTLANNPANYLIIDFYTDAQWGSYLIDDNCITATGRIRNLNIFKCRYEGKYMTLDEENYFDLWQRSIDYFMRFVLKYMPETRLIINGTKGCNVINNQEKTKNIEDALLKKINNLWERMDRYVKDRYAVPIIRIENQFLLDPNYPYGGVLNEVVHYPKEHFAELFQKLTDYCDRNNEVGCLTPNTINLISNNDFRSGFRFWNYKNDSFILKSVEGVIGITPQNVDIERKYLWIWSNPIEIDADGTEPYTLCFDYIANDENATRSINIFGIRQFEYAKQKDVNEAKKVIALSKPKTEVGVKRHFSYTFYPTDKYIRVGPCVQSEGFNVTFFNICLTKGKKDEYVQYQELGITVSELRRQWTDVDYKWEEKA